MTPFAHAVDTFLTRLTNQAFAAMEGVPVDDLNDWRPAIDLEDVNTFYALATHLTGATMLCLIPVIPALIMWLIKRGASPFVDDHGREALNFQISLCIYAVSSLILTFCSIGVVLLIGVYALAIVGMILAAVAANKGQFYRYPMTIRFF